MKKSYTKISWHQRNNNVKIINQSKLIKNIHVYCTSYPVTLRISLTLNTFSHLKMAGIKIN